MLDIKPLLKRGWTKEQAETYVQIQRQVQNIDDELKEITNPRVYAEKYERMYELNECNRNLQHSFDRKAEIRKAIQEQLNLDSRRPLL